MSSPASSASAPLDPPMRRSGLLEEVHHVLIFRLACQHQHLYKPSSRYPRLDLLGDAGTAGQTREAWRDNFEGRGSRSSTEDYPALPDSARAWIKIMDEKIKAHELAKVRGQEITDGSLKRQRALAEKNAEHDGPDPDLINDMVVPDEPATMPQTKSVQKWPPTRPLSTPYSPRTSSESPSRGRKRRRRCSSQRSERSIEASNERRRSGTPRRDSVSMSRLQELVESVHERLTAREARLIKYEESLFRHEENLVRRQEHMDKRQENMDKHFDQVMELLRSNLGGRPDPTAPMQESAPVQES